MVKLPRIDELPRVARLAISAYLLTTGLGYNYALLQLGMKVGVTRAEVAAHYAGGNVSERQSGAKKAPAPAPTAKADSDAEVNLDSATIAVPAAPPMETIPAPSLSALVQEGHVHLFGMTSLFFNVVVVALLLVVSDGLKTLLVLVPFAAIVCDHLGFLATRFISPQFVYLIMVAGSAMALSHLTITLLAFWQMWRPARRPTALETAHA
jgi:hypothetical protein